MDWSRNRFRFMRNILLRQLPLKRFNVSYLDRLHGIIGTRFEPANQNQQRTSAQPRIRTYGQENDVCTVIEDHPPPDCPFNLRFQFGTENAQNHARISGESLATVPNSAHSEISPAIAICPILAEFYFYGGNRLAISVFDAP